MFGKPLGELIYQDIVDLVQLRKEAEGQHLDYKQSIESTDKGKKDLAEDVASFANANGGYLIFGITDNKEIIGIEEKIEGRPIIEWLNQVLSSKIEPIVFYTDPKPIEIPNSKKIILVLHIPESTKKPHYCTADSRYRLRVNDRNLHASHYQIRDMFEFSKNRANDLNDFLKEKNLFSETDENFGENFNTKRLANDITYLITNWGMTGSIQPKEKTPKVIFSLIPTDISSKKMEQSIPELKLWMEKNIKGYQPLTQFDLIRTYNPDPAHNGIVYRVAHNHYSSLSYFEILRNGYVEVGFSNSVCLLKKNKVYDSAEYFITLTPIVGYALMLLGFAKKFYEYIQYHGEIKYQLSFANVLNYKLTAFNEQYSMTDYLSNSDKKNRYTNSFKIVEELLPSQLDYESIVNIVKPHALTICNAFGVDSDCCFYDDNRISLGYMPEIHKFQDHRKEYKGR